MQRPIVNKIPIMYDSKKSIFSMQTFRYEKCCTKFVFLTQRTEIAEKNSDLSSTSYLFCALFIYKSVDETILKLKKKIVIVPSSLANYRKNHLRHTTRIVGRSTLGTTRAERSISSCTAFQYNQNQSSSCTLVVLQLYNSNCTLELQFQLYSV